jgi:predicted nucleic acid-binding protein
MADILLDSDIIIAWLRGHGPISGPVLKLLENRHTLLWTPVSIAEIFCGVKAAEIQQIEKLFLVLETIPISESIGRQAGLYLQKYSKSHGIELGDALIAATAGVSGFMLWTMNKKHFPMPGIRLFSPAPSSLGAQ